MKEKILKKEELNHFINFLLEKRSVYAPVEKDNIVSFKKIDSPDDLDLEFSNSKIPPKNLIFPQKEVLFKYEITGDGIDLKEIPVADNNKIILFIRPCDAHGIQILKNFFSSGKYKDNFVLKREKDTILIGLACNNPRLTCFCPSVGLSPFYENDVDIFFIELENKYLVKGITEDGKAIIDNLNTLKDANDEDIKEADHLSSEALESISQSLNLDSIEEMLDGLFNNDIWEKFSIDCLGCGTCTYLCPTCSCFDVIDEKITKRTGRRVRIWDNCQFPLFTLHGSGHNPRPSKKERTRQRIYHKFNYYPKNYNYLGCVGCGRCIINCPNNNDIRETLTMVQKIGRST